MKKVILQLPIKDTCLKALQNTFINLKVVSLCLMLEDEKKMKKVLLQSPKLPIKIPFSYLESDICKELDVLGSSSWQVLPIKPLSQKLHFLQISLVRLDHKWC